MRFFEVLSILNKGNPLQYCGRGEALHCWHRAAGFLGLPWSYYFSVAFARILSF